jgi:hypothetical protein
MSFDRDLGVDV